MKPSRTDRVLLAAGTIVAATIASCTEPVTPSLGKAPASSSITVKAAEPDTIPVDTTLSVRILGSGFGSDATVEYALAGVSSSKVTVPQVTFVSSRELIATTVVAADAPLASYDIVVTSGGKRGIGVEKLVVVAVVTKIELPMDAAFDIDPMGRVAGYVHVTERVKGTRTSYRVPTVWIPSTPFGTSGALLVLEGRGEAKAISTTGEIAGWGWAGPGTPQEGLLWDPSLHRLGLPAGATSGWVNRISPPLADGSRLITGGASNTNAVVWRVQGSGPALVVQTISELPGNALEATGVNASGLVVGNQPAMKWEFDGSSWRGTPLGSGTSGDGAIDVNSHGVIVGGDSGDGVCRRPVVWPAGSTIPQVLPGGCGWAWGINDAGMIAGDVGEPGEAFRPALWVPAGAGLYSIIIIGSGSVRDLSEPYLEGGLWHVNVVGWLMGGVMWKVRLP